MPDVDTAVRDTVVNIPSETPYPSVAQSPVEPSPIANEKSKEKSKDEKKKEERIPFLKLFRFADRTDHVLMGIGSLAAIIMGLALPAFAYAWGRLLDDLASNPSEMQNKISFWALILAIMGISCWAAASIGVCNWIISGERQVRRMRRVFFSSILRQEVGWFDITKTGDLASRLSADTQLVQAILSEKMENVIQYFSCFIFSFVFAFWKSWRLTLIMLTVVPVLAICGGIFSKVLESATIRGQTAYASAGAVATEVLSSIRTVYSFSGMDREAARYGSLLNEAEKIGIRKGFYIGGSLGFTMCILFSSYALAFYYGSWLIQWGINTGGDIISVFFSILMGSFQLGQAAPIVGTAFTACAAAFKIYQVVDRESEINLNAEGTRIQNLQGHIEFKEVGFCYPARDIAIFEKFDLDIQPNHTTALVGSSGCGKSSVIALIERFYDPTEGEILVDGVPLKTLDLVWWRQQVAVVTQEPTLFSTSIIENVRYAKPDATDEEIIQACKEAYIHDTIASLPQGYQTQVGEAGSQLSGGQKQRVSIARAIIKNPRVLLLDEATSALDRESESKVQQALQNVMQGRTVVVIAHRLATVVDAKCIAYLKATSAVTVEGNTVVGCSRVFEMGTHAELIEKRGEYAALARAQLCGLDDSEDIPEARPRHHHRHPGPSSSVIGFTSAVGAEHRGALDKAPASPLTEAKLKAAVEEEKEPEISKMSSMARVGKMSAPERWWLTLGCVASAIAGTSYPIYAVLFAEIMSVFYESNAEMRRDVPKCVLICSTG